MTFHEQLMEQFPIRKNKTQKEAFRAWAVQQAQDAGWQARTEATSSGMHKNVVIGDPEHAAVVFTAHYDTPANMVMPNLMLPRNIPLYLCYVLVLVAVMVVISQLVAFLLCLLPPLQEAQQITVLVIYFGLLLLMLLGPANKHNANDNTSGVAAVLSLMATLPPEHRGKAAFLLFDNEEKGCLGSKGYAKDHQQLQYSRLVVNMDCVGVGEHMLIISTKLARRCTGFQLMQRCLQETPGCTAHFFDSKTSVGSSDHKNFKCGVAVFACKKMPVVGFYAPWIHTRHDTVCQQSNLDYLTTGLNRFVAQLGGSNAEEQQG